MTRCREPVVDTIAAAAVQTVVCVPVRDEQDLLPDLIQALACQRGVANGFLTCLVFDGCRDASEAVAHETAARVGLAIVCDRLDCGHAANAGRARRAAMRLGQRVIAHQHGACLLTTDADSVPADDWVAANIAALAEVDVVAGHIERANAPHMAQRCRWEQYLARLRHLERTIDPISYDPVPSHSCLGGASLGFRAGVYAALGGFANIASREDITLVTAARRAGFRVRHDRRVRVSTSSRLRGRAIGGLADELRASRAGSPPPKLEHPADAAKKYTHRARARRAYTACDRARALARLAESLGMAFDVLAKIAETSASAEAFTMRVAPDSRDTRSVSLAEAERELARLEIQYGLTCHE